jgi:hypothetical protein
VRLLNHAALAAHRTIEPGDAPYIVTVGPDGLMLDTAQFAGSSLLRDLKAWQAPDDAVIVVLAGWARDKGHIGGYAHTLAVQWDGECVAVSQMPPGPPIIHEPQETGYLRALRATFSRLETRSSL